MDTKWGLNGQNMAKLYNNARRFSVPSYVKEQAINGSEKGDD